MQNLNISNMNTDIKSKQLTIMKNYLKKIKAFGKRAIKSYWDGFVEIVDSRFSRAIFFWTDSVKVIRSSLR